MDQQTARTVNVRLRKEDQDAKKQEYQRRCDASGRF